MDWIKMHLSWAEGLEALTDDNDEVDEAACGRFILALMKYVKTGEKPKLTGSEKVLFAMAVADLKKDYAFLEKEKADEEAKKQAISEVRRDAANVRWGKADVQTDANACKSTDEQSKPEQTMQNAPNKNKEVRSKNTDKEPEEREKEKNKKRKREKPVSESQYDQRPNTEPDGQSTPQWLLDYAEEITGYSDPAGNPDGPDRSEIEDQRDAELNGS